MRCRDTEKRKYINQGCMGWKWKDNDDVCSVTPEAILKQMQLHNWNIAYTYISSLLLWHVEELGEKTRMGNKMLKLLDDICYYY